MATLVSDQIRWMADQYVHHCGYASAVLSGIVPNAQHLRDGGFHCSVEDLRRYGNEKDYSNTRPDDHDFNVRYGAGVDVSMNKTDMVLHHSRIHAVWADLSDPRRKYFNAVNTWAGSGDAVRLDFVTNKASYASPDHRWHGHDETRRRWLLDDKAVRAKVSVWKGEPKSAWTAREEPATSAPTTQTGGVKMLDVGGKLPELKRGMNDPVAGFNYVWRLQLLLGVTVDGDYGPKTAAAVAGYYQAQLNRKTDGGTVDAAMWRRLFAIQD